jgi:hypothetical protein
MNQLIMIPPPIMEWRLAAEYLLETDQWLRVTCKRTFP